MRTDISVLKCIFFKHMLTNDALYFLFANILQFSLLYSFKCLITIKDINIDVFKFFKSGSHVDLISLTTLGFSYF